MNPGETTRNIPRRRFLRWAGISALATAGSASYAWGSNTLQVRRSSRRIWGAPRPLRVGLITDLHAPHFLFPMDELVDEVNRAECDLLAIAGDTVDTRGNERLAEAFEPMRAPLGKFACLGNRERAGRADLALLRASYEKAGVRLLVNAAATVEAPGGSVRVVGLDDLLTGKPDYALLERDPAPRTVVLMHCPDAASSVARRSGPGTVMVSGHTHGGQIAPMGVVLFLPAGCGPYVKGWYDVKPIALHVSVGLGNAEIPLRIGVPPTLAVLDLT